MTNLEKYEDKIKLIIYSGEQFAIREHEGEVVRCSDVACCDCKFRDVNISCCRQRAKWMQEEYEEHKEPEFNWMNVKVDTPVLVSDNGADWYKRHFKSYYPESREVCTFNDGATSWSYTGYCKWKYAKLAESEDEE